MSVKVAGLDDAGMAEVALHVVQRRAAAEHEAGGGVAQIVNAHVRQTRLFEERSDSRLTLRDPAAYHEWL